MPIGPAIRSALGPFERSLSAAYRRIFVRLDSLVALTREWSPAARILEVGCGEGELTERLSRGYPAATLTGIDITPKVGRLFRGDRSRVTFHHYTLHDFVAEHPAEFDLVLIADVLHHAPWPLHRQLLMDAKAALAPGGRFVLKDWERRRNPIHCLNWLSDRFLTGDRVRYGTAVEFRRLVEEVFGDGTIVWEGRIPPWQNNIVFFVQA